MIGLSILFGILLLFWLLSLARIGGWVEYSQTGILVKIKVGPFYIQVFPRKPEAEKGKRSGKKGRQSAKQNRSPGGSIELVKELLPVVAEAAGALKRRIRIDDLQLDLMWSDPDPARCAVGFGAANALVGMIWPPIEQNFNVKDYRIRTDVDFNAGKPVVYLLAQATLTVGQALSFVLRMGKTFLKVYQQVKPESDPGSTNTKEQKEAV